MNRCGELEQREVLTNLEPEELGMRMRLQDDLCSVVNLPSLNDESTQRVNQAILVLGREESPLTLTLRTRSLTATIFVLAF
jgi:hypothetical protein